MSPEPTKHNRDLAQPAQAGGAIAPNARHNAAAGIESILPGNAAALLHKAIDMGLQGNVPAMRLAFEEMHLAEQKRSSEFHLPAALDTVAGLAENSAAVITAYCRGQLRFEVAAGTQALLLTQHKFVVTRDKGGAALGEGEAVTSSARAEDFENPMQTFALAIGLKSKVLEVLEPRPGQASQE